MNNVHARAVRKAADLVGGRAKLARLLQVPESEIEKWLAGEAKPPREVFLRVVDIVIDGGGASHDSEPPEPPAGRDAAGSSHAHYD